MIVLYIIIGVAVGAVVLYLLMDRKMDVLRIDFNLRPLKYWQFSDGADRQGLTEIHYVNGLYALLSSLRRAFPALRIDNCASGGRRPPYLLHEFLLDASFWNIHKQIARLF